MKKLLSILSVVTITGTSLPSAIASSNYEKNNDKEINNKNLNNSNLEIKDNILNNNLKTDSNLKENYDENCLNELNNFILKPVWYFL